MGRLVFWGAWLSLLGASALAAGDDAKQVYVQANLAYEQRQYASALQQYQAALRKQPGMGPAWWGDGNCLYLLGRKREALGAYLQAQRLMPDSAQVAQRVRAVQVELNPAPAFAAAPGPTAAAPAPATARNWWSPLWRSALLPGWGQAYNGQTHKAWLLGGATWASFAGVAGTYFLGSQADADYEAATNASDAVSRYQTAYNYYVANQVFYVVFGLLYTSNILDAALNANAPDGGAGARAALPGDLQLAVLPDGFLLRKEWTW